MDWYRVVKTIKGRRYHYWQKTYRVGKQVRTLNKYIGPVDGIRQTKVSDQEGNPLRVYHGTLETFDTFDPETVGQNTGWDNSRFGFFFSDAKSDVEDFVNNTRTPGDHRPVQLKEAYLDIRKPLDLTTIGIFTKKEQAPLIVELLQGEKMTEDEALASLNENIDLGNFDEVFEAIYSSPENKRLMQERGYDGIISQFGKDEKGDVIREFVAFEPSQIKEIPR